MSQLFEVYDTQGKTIATELELHQALRVAKAIAGCEHYSKPFQSNHIYLFGPGDGTTTHLVRSISRFRDVTISKPNSGHLHSEFDARVWASEFVRIWNEIGRPDPDVDWMHTWFANAIMTGYDHRARQEKENGRANAVPSEA